MTRVALVAGLNPTSHDKALDKAYKIKGKYKAEEKPTETKNTYNFILTPEFQGRIKPITEELKKQFRNAQPIETTPQNVEINEEK